MKKTMFILVLMITASFTFYNCSNPAGSSTAAAIDSAERTKFGGFASEIAWGQHLVIITGCSDCHTSKVMTARGPADDTTMYLAGCLSQTVLPALTPEQAAKGTAITTDQTAWAGPWGKSFAANITSDTTGIGNWSEQQFIDCIRKGLFKGLANSRPLMPPMPWQDYSHLTDNELKAIFAFLKSTKPVHNIVPPYQPPVTAMK